MKILFITDIISGFGGRGNYALSVIEKLRQKGHEIELTRHKYFDDILKSLYHQHLSSYFSLNWKRKIENKIEDFKPDIIFVQGIGAIISPYSLKNIQNRKIPIIYRMSGAKEFHLFGIWDEQIENLFDILSNITFFRRATLIPKKMLHNNLIRKVTDHFIAPSTTVSKHTKPRLGIPDDEISVIPHPTLFSIANETSQENNNILYVGRLNKEKGVEYLIRAFKLINNGTNKKMKLIIVGDGPERKKLENITKKLDIGDKVKFLGNVEHEKLKSIYKKGLVYVLPSIVKEGFGLTILESMSQGTPVITTDMGAQNELIEEGYNGLLVEPENPNDLAKKIQYLVNNQDLLKKMSENSLETAKKHSLENYANKLENLFQKLVEEYE